MSRSILSRYIDPEVLGHITQQPIEPRGLVIGNLAGAHKSPLSGFAVEFAGHREYVPGDEPKHIDWRVYFAREKLFVKQYQLETNFVCHLALDTSASMRYGENRQQKLFYASQMATMLAYAIIRQNDKVSFSTFDNRLRRFVSPSNSLDQIQRLTLHLEELEAEEKTDLASCLVELVGRTGRREIVMVLSDFFTEDLGALEDAVHRLRYQRHEVVLLQILHANELTFHFEGMVKFIDLESGDSLLAQSDALRRDYLVAFRGFNRRLEEIAQRSGCERVLVDTSRSLGETLVDYLNQRSMLGRTLG